jgi:rod shape-determining protein MreB and related proteins
MSNPVKDVYRGMVCCEAGRRPDVPPARADLRGEPTAVAVDLGSGTAEIWAVGHGAHAIPTVGEARSQPRALVRRGRIVDDAGCASVLTQLLQTYPRSVPAGPVVIACRPVLATPADRAAIRGVVTEVLAPARVLLIATVRAAAISCGAANGVVLIADVGAHLTEIAVLVDGRVAPARRVDLGTHDLASGATPGRIADIITRFVADLRREPQTRRLAAAALARGVVVVGDGATMPALTTRLAANLRVTVRTPAAPRSAALTGAGLAAMAACRHPATA